MIRTLYRSPEGVLDATLSSETAWARLQETPGALLWIDICQEPHEQAEHVLREVLGFHPLAVDDALNESHVPKIDDWSDYLYITLHSVTHEPDSWEELGTLEVDIFVGRGYVVTYQSRPVASVERVWAMVQRDERHLSRGSDNVLYLLADEL